MGYVKSASQLAKEMQQIWERADLSERDLTAGERAEVEDLIVQIKSQKSIEDLGRELGGGFTSFMGDGSSGGMLGAASPGEAFVSSAGYKSVRRADARGQSWTSGIVEVALHQKGTLLEGVGSPGSGSGGGLVPSPAGRAGRGRQAVPAAHVRGPARCPAGDREHGPVRGGGHRDVRGCGCG